MAVAFVRQAINGSSTAALSGAVTIIAPSAGNVLVITVSPGSTTAGAQVSSMSATGGAFTRVSLSGQNATGLNRSEIWVATGVTGTSVTINFSASSKWAANVAEFSGLSTAVASIDASGAVNTGSTAGAATISLPATSAPPAAGDLLVGAMSLSKSSSITDYAFTTGAPDSTIALTSKASGATTASNVNLSPQYTIAPNQPTQIFSWGVNAAWQWAGAACILRAQARSLPLSGTITPSPTITKTTARSLLAALTAAASLVSGSGGTAYAQSLAATLTASGLLVLSTGKLVSAIVTPSGSLLRATVAVLSATLASSGSLRRSTIRALSGGMSGLAGVVSGSRTYLVTLSATLGASGLLVRSAARTLSGTMASSASLLRAITHSLSGSMTATSSLKRTTTHSLAASLSAVGSLSRGTTRALTGTLSGLGGVLSRSISKRIAGTLSAVGSLTRSAQKALSASLHAAGSLARSTALPLSASLSAVGSLSRATKRAFSASLSGLRGVLTSAKNGGSIAYQQVLSASLTASGSIARVSTRSLSASIAASGSISRVVGKALSGSLTLSGALRRSIVHGLFGSLSTAGTLARSTARSLTAQLQPVGLILRGPVKALAGTIAAAGSMGPRSITKVLASSLASSGQLSRGIVRAISAVLGLTATLIGANPVEGPDTSLLIVDQEVSFSASGVPVRTTFRASVVAWTSAKPVWNAILKIFQLDQEGPRTAVLDQNGDWSLYLPWPSVSKPPTTMWTITRSDGSTIMGNVPQGVHGPVSVMDLMTTYGWKYKAGY